MSELSTAGISIPLPPAGLLPGPRATNSADLNASAGDSDRRYIRGSSLLLAGRLISMFLNFAIQIVTVRYLSKSDYGVFAYAFAAAAMGSSMIQLGLDKALPRLVPMYVERGDYARIFGSLAVATGTIWGLGISLFLLLLGLRGLERGTVVSDPRALSLLLVMIAVSPINAYTSVLERVIAVFASARAIFFRRHVLAPGLKLAAVLLVVFTSGGVYLLAYGYVVGGLVGIGLYIAILLSQWRKRGLLRHLRLKQLTWPARELFSFSLPLLSSDLLMILRTSFVVIVLEHYHRTGAVAEYQAVVPIAGLNMLAYEAFSILFVPIASRMFARRQTDAIGRLYWTTATWIAVLSFPVFAVTCALAEPLTVLFFGSKYAGSGTLLTILAVGYYSHAALGFNSASLRVHGKLKLIVASDVVAAGIVVLLSFLLIPRYGALGAAITTSGTLILYNVATQVALRFGNTGIQLLEGQFLRAYAIAAVVAGSLLLGQRVLNPPVYVGVAVAGLLSLVIIKLTRRALNPEATFPELLKVPFVRQLIS